MALTGQASSFILLVLFAVTFQMQSVLVKYGRFLEQNPIEPLQSQSGKPKSDINHVIPNRFSSQTLGDTPGEYKSTSIDSLFTREHTSSTGSADNSTPAPTTTMTKPTTLQSHVASSSDHREPGVVVVHGEDQSEVDTTNDSQQQQRGQCAVARNENRNTNLIDISPPLECLQRTTPSMTLEYPDDAEEHYQEIRTAMAPWAQHATHKMHTAAGYSGPWIENKWISHFEALYDTEHNQTCLFDHFGPFIPLFVPWVDHWVESKYRYPEGFLDTLLSVLRPNVPYVTVSQNDEGLRGKGELDMGLIPNVLVLSAGGYGHVPIPLLKQEEKRNNAKNVSDRTMDVSYVGSLQHAPKAMRQRMHERLLAQTSSSNLQYQYFYGEEWRRVMAESRFSLVPRGFGRTAYHLMETLQMGLVPIYVYLDADVPWVPYSDLFNEIGFVVEVQNVDQLLSELQHMTANEIRERERRIETLRLSHFTFDGTMDQIGRFLKGENNDLRCQALPTSVTG